MPPSSQKKHPTLKRFRDLVRSEMKTRGVVANDLAPRLHGVSRAAFYKFLSGKEVTVSTLGRILDALEYKAIPCRKKP